MNRIFPPTRYDKAPFKTICTVKEEGGDTLYIQVSRYVDTPMWMRVGEFLEKSLKYKMGDDEFIDSCIHSYDGIIKRT